MFSKIENDDQDEDDFRCPKCKWYFSSMTKPYILPCNHNICLKCIDSLIKEKRTECPICKSNFNKKEKDSFQINLVFLNILVKILQSKIILCKKCNKIFYWKEHYELCDQSYFIETNKLFDDIKLACEEGIKIIKLFKSQPNIFMKYKKNIFGKLKKTLKQISDLYKKEINNGIKKLFITRKKIDFNASKKEIISFLELCLPFDNYFDKNEINNILEKYKYNSPQRNMHFINNNLGLSPYNDHLFSYSPFCLKNINDYPAKKSSTIMISGMSKGNQKIINYRKNTDSKVINNYNYKNDDKSKNILQKIINDLNQKNHHKHTNNLSHINIKEINRNSNGNLRGLDKQRRPSNNLIYSSVSKQKNKNNRFNIYDLLNEKEPNEENDKKKIIVGLKDVKVISNNRILKKRYDSDKNDKNKNNKNLIHIQNRSLNSIDKNRTNNKNRVINGYNMKNLNLNKIKEINNINIISDESEASTIRVENPSLCLLRSTEFTKRIYPLNANDKRKQLLRIQNAGKNSEEKKRNSNNSIKIQISKKSSSSELLINKENENNNDINNNDSKNIKMNGKINLSSMNKLFKHFNKVRDSTNEINNFNNYMTFISDYIFKDVDYRIKALWNNILDDYNLLLNEMSSSFNQSHRRYIVTIIENTKKISIYDANLNKFKINDLEKILTQYQYLDNSMSIDHDDNDLIFISGGLEKSEYNCSNIFLILNSSKKTIEYDGTLQERKAYHSTLYHDNKLYLIGGIDSNKKVSKECQVFSLIDKQWHNLPNLNEGRANSSICIYNNNSMYVFRGRDDKDVLDSIEYIKFNIRNSWKIFKPIDYGYVWNMAENSLVMTLDRGKILICGGEDSNGNFLSDTFLYETHTKTIYKGIDLVIPASFRSHGCFNLGKYYFIDIKNKKNNNDNFGLGAIHIYDPKENSWTLN